MDLNRPEEVEVAKAWHEVFPNEKVPNVLSQPCCSQFAVSRDALRRLPKSRYQHFRSWIEKTPLKDDISGRVWEYVWQYIFKGVYEFCPNEAECYCRAYGVCFPGGEKEYNDWFDMRGKVKALDAELKDAMGKADLEKTLVDQIAELDRKMRTSKSRALNGEATVKVP